MYQRGSNHPDEQLIDSLVEEQFLIGGVDIFVYPYIGPTGNVGSTDETKPDYTVKDAAITDLGNYVWGETAEREYSKDAIILPMTYQQEDAAFQMMIPGLFLFDTMPIEIPYNLMLKRVGRRIMQGDVIEMPHYRDENILDSDNVVNRFYTVQDSFFAAEGYSAIYTRHIWKLRLVPLTDSPEFADLLGDPNDDESLASQLSSAQKELEIMDIIIGQASKEVPFLHWDNENNFTNTDETGETSIRGTHDNNREGLPPTDYTEVLEFPVSPTDGEWVLRVDMKVPLFYQYVESTTTWRQFVYGGRQPWVGPDITQSDLLNNTDTYTDSNGNVKPSRQNIHDVIKPDIDNI